MLSKLPTIEDAFTWLSQSNTHSREAAIRHFSARGVESYIIIGAILCKSRDDEDWKKAQCRSFREWVENEQRISHTQASRMMVIWDNLSKYIAKHYELVKTINFVNLYEVARVSLKLPEIKVIELMENAAVNTERGFRDNIREINNLPASDTCDHVDIITIVTTVEVCKRCNKVLSRKETKSGGGYE